MPRQIRISSLLVLVFLGCGPPVQDQILSKLTECQEARGSCEEELRRNVDETRRMRQRLESEIAVLREHEAPDGPSPIPDDGGAVQIADPPALETLLEQYLGGVKRRLDGLENQSRRTQKVCEDARSAAEVGVQETAGVASSIGAMRADFGDAEARFERCSADLLRREGERRDLQLALRRLREALQAFDRERLICDDCPASLDLRDRKERVILDFHRLLQAELGTLEVQLGE